MERIQCINHNLKEDTLVVFSENGLSKGYYFRDINDLNNNSFKVYVSTIEYPNDNFIQLHENEIRLLSHNDIYVANTMGTLIKVYSSISQDNVLFITEQCNNKCLMCSQPPRKKNDIEYFFNLNSVLIKLLPKSTTKLGITGGEPTIDQNKLTALLTQISLELPNTSLHLLSNGRNFKSIDFVKNIARIKLNDILFGIPLHSDFYRDHDFIANSTNAYYETLKGLYNLARFDQKIEIRIVVNRLNYHRLTSISEYIFKNLPFISHIAFMALEYTGFVPKNKQLVFIDPIEYKLELENAVLLLDSWGMNVSVFNLPLCLISKPLYKFAKKSISDWKVRYFDECNQCILKSECGGEFNTSIMYSSHIKAIK